MSLKDYGFDKFRGVFGFTDSLWGRHFSPTPTVSIGSPGNSDNLFLLFTTHVLMVMGIVYVWTIQEQKLASSNSEAGHIARRMRAFVVVSILGIPQLLLFYLITFAWMDFWREAVVRGRVMASVSIAPVAIHLLVAAVLHLRGLVGFIHLILGAISQRQWRQHGRCPSCGYEVLEIQHQCPECGTTLEARPALTADRVSAVLRLVRGWPGWFAIVLLVVLAMFSPVWCSRLGL